MKRLLFFMVLVLLTVSSATAFAQDEPVEGGTLNYGIAAITAFDPVFIADSPSFAVSSLIYSSLTREWRNEEGQLEVIPDLAESWEISEDGTVITFHLREGVTFHDGNAVFAEGEGREVVADDVVYSFTRSLEEEGSSAATSDLTAVFESVEAIDDYTVQLNLSAPDGLLFNGARGITSIVIYAQEAVEQLGEDYATNPVGSGPFEFVELIPDDRVVLQRNEDYYIYPNLDEIVFHIIPEDTTQVIALETGEVDFIGDVPDVDIPRLRDDENFFVNDLSCPVSQQFTFNIAAPPFDDIRMRQAISFAVNGPAISQVIQPNSNVPGCGTAGPGVPGHDPDMCSNLFPYAPDQTAALLTELGYEDTNGDGLVDINGENLVIPIEVWNLPEMPRVAEAVVSQLNDAGIGTELEVVEFGTWIDDFFASAEKMMGWTGFCGIGGTIDFWGENSVFATSMNIVMPEAQQMLTQASQIYDLDERGAVIQEAANMIYGEYVSLPIGFFDAYYAYNVSVKDMPTPTWWLNYVTDRSNVWISQ